MIGTLDEIYQDMKSGVYDFTDNGKCTSCGACCTALLPVTRKEWRDIKRYIKKHNIKPCDHVTGTPFASKPNVDITCPFRDNVNRICTIYELRPAICKAFKCDKSSKNELDKYDAEFAKKDMNVVNMWELFDD